MNRYVKIIGVAVLVGMVALVGAAAAFAQSGTPTPTGCPGAAGGFGLMAEYRNVMHTRVAEALGLTLDEFNAALAAGKTPYVVAQEKGVDFSTVQAAMQAGMAEVLKQAVADGKITQAQADAITQRHAQMGARHLYGSGPMMGRSGRFGAPGGFKGACPNATPTP